jgi:uncharacterized protein YecE (DUF72 family)
MADIKVGTSAFTAAGWVGSFYPEGMNPREFLTYYATRFSTVEIDSTFYRTPSPATVKGWAAKTPEGFLIGAKVPQVITHEKCLVDCQAELTEFVSTMDLLGHKLGPMLLQFPYFNKESFKTGDEFLARLKPFLEQLPKGYRFALEIRNKNWLNEKFADLLRQHNVALALQDQAWMPPPDAMNVDYITADFAYIRLLGDRKGIEKLTKTWDKVVVDRSKDVPRWIAHCQRIVKRGISIFVYINNHYSGSGFKTAEQFEKLWNAR